MPAVTKEELFNYCHTYVMERIKRMRAEISETQTSANEETKSSAGDKHETARAMAQLEVEMNSRQLAEAERLLEVLSKILVNRQCTVTVPGALVDTSQGLFYLAISIGKVSVNQTTCYVISPDSPIGKILLGKKAGDTTLFNGNTLQIIAVT